VGENEEIERHVSLPPPPHHTLLSSNLLVVPSNLGDILLYDNHLVLYKSALDLTFYLVAPQQENEIMLQSVLAAFYDAVAMLLRHQVEKRSILENLDLVVLALDETIDNGRVLSFTQFSIDSHISKPPSNVHSIILETDSVAIASRVSRPKPDAGVQLSDITLNEQTIMQVRPTYRFDSHLILT
jgi:hypothetical protein